MLRAKRPRRIALTRGAVAVEEEDVGVVMMEEDVENTAFTTLKVVTVARNQESILG